LNSNEAGYFWSNKGHYAVCVLRGDLKRNFERFLLEILEEIPKVRALYTILSFRDVRYIDPFLVPLLIQCQSGLRDKGVLKVCGVSKEWKEMLMRAGGLRNEEICVDIPHAINEIITIKRKMNKKSDDIIFGKKNG
jgi:hypothetical protein